MSRKTVTQMSDDVGAFTDTLWNGTVAVRNSILNDAFIQHIISGDFDPSKFGKFGVQNTLFTFNTHGFIELAKSKTGSDIPIQTILEQVSAEYQNSYAAMKITWSVQDTTGYNLDPATQAYVSHERTVATDNTPVYTLVAVLARMRLWSWLGGHMQKANMGVYRRWATLTFDPQNTAYEAVQTALNAAFARNIIDLPTAQNIFDTSMQCERDFFTAFV
ncbi:uncharacterized protein LOC110451247 [Mizuhopecten yessoensis]|nr:uncharacterized protein LOC110451247 [Mizuhopecten yessoensis]